MFHTPVAFVHFQAPKRIEGQLIGLRLRSGDLGISYYCIAESYWTCMFSIIMIPSEHHAKSKFKCFNFHAVKAVFFVVPYFVSSPVFLPKRLHYFPNSLLVCTRALGAFLCGLCRLFTEWNPWYDTLCCVCVLKRVKIYHSCFTFRWEPRVVCVRLQLRLLMLGNYLYVRRLSCPSRVCDQS